MKSARAVIYLNKNGPNMGINFAWWVRSEVIIKWLTTSSHGESGSISRGIIRLILANQEFDTGNICVENWLTICNNLLMDHQQHYWYIKNSSRAVQNTNNSIYVLNTAADWLTAAAASYWSAARGGGRGGAGGARAVITAGVCWGCKVNVTLWETSASSASKSSIRRFVITEKTPTRAFSCL